MKEFINYHKWADNLLIEMLEPLSDKDFNQESSEIRSIKQLVGHYLSTYDNLIYSSSFKERLSKISSMTRAELISEISKSQKKFQELASKLDAKVPLQLTKDKSVNLDKDNYLLLFLDHLSYHRGQITHTIKLKGYKGVNTDYYDYQEHLVGLK